MIPDGDKRTFSYHKRASSTTQLNIETYVIYVEIHVLYGGSYTVFVFDRDPNLKEIENVLLIEIKRAITENNPYNPRANAPQRRDEPSLPKS
jgi:hypothetical protein